MRILVEANTADQQAEGAQAIAGPTYSMETIVCAPTHTSVRGWGRGTSL